MGRFDFHRFNVNGGSIAIGHSFCVTGMRVMVPLLAELQRRGGNLDLATV